VVSFCGLNSSLFRRDFRPEGPSESRLTRSGKNARSRLRVWVWRAQLRDGKCQETKAYRTDARRESTQNVRATPNSEVGEMTDDHGARRRERIVVQMKRQRIRGKPETTCARGDQRNAYGCCGVGCELVRCVTGSRM
jgi:hypothetical protein